MFALDKQLDLNQYDFVNRKATHTSNRFASLLARLMRKLLYKF